MYYELSPAYGRDYKTSKDVKQAWLEGKDFEGDYQLGFKPVNIDDIPKPSTVLLRYSRSTKVVSVAVKAGARSVERTAKPIIDYGKPTYCAYEDPNEQWLEWKRQAAALPRAELARHASVSTSNSHACRECFCCACLEVYREFRQVERTVEL